MTLQQLNYIITISEIGSINRAAEKLYVSQPSLTSAIKELGIGQMDTVVVAMGTDLEASIISVMIRAMRPLPSSKGWIVTNHKCAIAARIIGSVELSVLTHWMNCSIRAGTASLVGASKCTFCLPIGPLTTCIGSSPTRQLATVIL